MLRTSILKVILKPSIRSNSLKSLSKSDAFNSLISSKPIHHTEHGNTKPLSGTTYVAKDNISTIGEPTTCASLMLTKYNSPFNATVIDLLNEAGLTLIGKANMDEFGMGSATTNSYFGETINPLFENEKRVAGGSSGGSAAAVADNLSTFGLGTDTGGSVRLPASYCGIVGFKPSYGRVSRWGIVAYAQTLDTVGILANNVETTERVFNIINKYDDKDPTSLSNDMREKIKGNQIENNGETKLVIGIPQDFIIEDMSEDIRKSWLQVLKRLLKNGHQLKAVQIPSIEKFLGAYYAIATAEAASNLSRYDGIRYGYSKNEVTDSTFTKLSENRTTGFGPEVQRRIILGNYSLSSESGNHYFKATHVRSALVKKFDEIFKFPNVLADTQSYQRGDCDILLSPTSIGTAPTIEDYLEKNEQNFLSGYINDVMTVPASLAGLPAISVPWKNQAHGIQLMAQYGNDVCLFSIAKELEAMDIE